MTLTQLATSTSFPIEAVETDLLAVFTHHPDSDFASKHLSLLNTELETLKVAGISVFFVLDKEISTNDNNYYLDANRELLDLAPQIAGQHNLGENLVIYHKEKGEWIFADIKENPENSSDWIQALLQLAKNYAISEPDDGVYYRWGQQVPEDGEYLCKDCGFVLELKAGMIFPICEVCLSGEPTGPATPEEGYWEKI